MVIWQEVSQTLNNVMYVLICFSRVLTIEGVGKL